MTVIETATAAAGVSVVIVNWNTRERLLELLQALTVSRRAFSRPFEIVVVDNDSADGSADAVRERFPDVVLRPQDGNLGFGKGVNRGVEAASMPWVVLVNTDVETDSEQIEKLVAYADRQPGVGIVGPRIRDERGMIAPSCWQTPSLWSLFCEATWLYKLAPRSSWFNPRFYSTAVDGARDVECVSGCVFLVRRELFAQLGGLDEEYFMYFEETDLCVRARARGWQVHYAPVGEFMHEGGGSGDSLRERLFLEYRRSELVFHHAHGGLVGALVARALIVAWLLLRIPALLVLGLRGEPHGRSSRQRLGVYWRALGHFLSLRGGLVMPSFVRPE